MHFFTADLHLGHVNIIGFCDRPFTCVDVWDFRPVSEEPLLHLMRSGQPS